MSVIEEDDRETARFPGQRPPRASVGSHRIEEEVFGKAYDPRTVRRIWAFVKPYRRKIYLSVAAVLVFTATQLAMPLIIGRAIDSGMSASETKKSRLEMRPSMCRGTRRCSSVPQMTFP